MIRKYNYRLETGTVGTDDENIANVLYNINCMEMKASFTSIDPVGIDSVFGELFFMITDAKVHVNRFLKNADGKGAADAVVSALDESIQIVRNARQETGTEKMTAAFPDVYKKLLDIVPDVLLLDAQSHGGDEE